MLEDTWLGRAGHVLSDGEKTPLLWYWYCLAGAPGAAADRQGIVLLSSIRRARENLREETGTDGVSQVDGKARKKVQVSAHLIWSPAVEYSPFAFFSLFLIFSVAFCFIFLKHKHSPWASALRKQCRYGRADLCRLKIWPINFPPFFSLNPPLFPLPFALVSFLLVTPFVTSVSICLTHYSVLRLLVCPLALSPFGEGSASSCKAPRSSVIEDAGSK